MANSLRDTQLRVLPERLGDVIEDRRVTHDETFVRSTRRRKCQNLKFGEVANVNLAKKKQISLVGDQMFAKAVVSKTYASRESCVRHLPALRRFTIHDGMDQRVAEVDLFRARDGL